MIIKNKKIKKSMFCSTTDPLLENEETSRVLAFSLCQTDKIKDLKSQTPVRHECKTKLIVPSRFWWNV
jgi:hypothetical protein